MLEQGGRSNLRREIQPNIRIVSLGYNLHFTHAFDSDRTQRRPRGLLSEVPPNIIPNLLNERFLVGKECNRVRQGLGGIFPGVWPEGFYKGRPKWILMKQPKCLRKFRYGSDGPPH